MIKTHSHGQEEGRRQSRRCRYVKHPLSGLPCPAEGVESNSGKIILTTFADDVLKVDKTTVLQEARVFDETPIKPRRCCLILTKLISLVASGERLTPLEATDTFFRVTKLFQSNDVSNIGRMID